MNNVTPWVSCFKPVSIKDCFGRVQKVGCGSCPACQELKRNSLSNRLALEEHRSKYCSFEVHFSFFFKKEFVYYFLLYMYKRLPRCATRICEG